MTSPPLDLDDWSGASLPTLRWRGDAVSGSLLLLDQTKLPDQIVEHACHDPRSLWEAIRSLRVRGAPAIGVAAAYGVVLGARESIESARDLADSASRAIEYLATSRPTAVNLFWALERMRSVLGQELERTHNPLVILNRLLGESRVIEEEERAVGLAIGRHGARRCSEIKNFLTHCNAGSLATTGPGTALAVIYELKNQGRDIHVWVDETRPLLQGARLTAWELMRRGVACTLVCDNMAANLMRQGKVDAVIVGADRIAANGDVANKIGTYSAAVLARAHQIPLFVAAPCSTFDLSCPSGDKIPIEQRAALEILELRGVRVAPQGTAVDNPAFDVTPASLVSAIITERGIIEPVSIDTVGDGVA